MSFMRLHPDRLRAADLYKFQWWRLGAVRASHSVAKYGHEKMGVSANQKRQERCDGHGLDWGRQGHREEETPCLSKNPCNRSRRSTGFDRREAGRRTMPVRRWELGE